MKGIIINVLMLMMNVAAAQVGACRQLQPCRVGDLRDGDLLFFAPEQSNAITQVTQGIDSVPIDHVAIVHLVGSCVVTIEATHRGVVVMPIDSTRMRALQRREAVMVARVNGDVDVAESIGGALRHLSKPYDFFFEPSDSAIYCSELVQKAYVDTGGKPVFNTIAMSFHTPDGKILPYWTEYYRRAGKTVPEGAPGTNPGQLSRSQRVVILGRLCFGTD
ncbi:MAG: YiiX/YebB-like N1pC/P60 family cysteine hydrolase [Muribaculaceae bacterium]